MKILMKSKPASLITILLSVLLLMAPEKSMGQGFSNKGFSYQAVARSQDGKPIENKSIVVEISILNSLETNQLVYKELHTLKTNSFGLFTLIIGEGTNTQQGYNPDFSNIDWSNGDYFIQISLNFGQGLMDMGLVRLQAVPFAYIAGKALSSPIPQINLEELKNVNIGSIAVDQTLKWDGNNWVVADKLSLKSLLILNQLNASGKITTDSLKGNYISVSTINSGKINLATGVQANEISDDPTMGANSSFSIPTQKAVKAYIDQHPESDPLWTVVSSDYYTKINLQASGSSQVHFNNITNKPVTLSGYGISDAMSTSHTANSINTSNILNWTTAFLWGNHAGLYRPVTYVPSWTEITSKPSFSNVAFSGNYNDLINKPTGISADWNFITNNPFDFNAPVNGQIIRYNSTTGKWENWTPAYLTTFTENDPVWTTASTNYYTKSNLQTTGQSQVNFGNISNRPSTISGYGITDAMSSSHPANAILAIDITNWTTAYSWGNHTGLYRPISYVPSWVEITGKPSFSTVATSGNFNDLSSTPFNISSPSNNQLLRYNSTSGKWENWTPTYLASFTEVDPAWASASPNYYTKTNLQTSGQSQINFDNISNKPSTISGYGITDAMTSSHPANAISATDISNWNSAYSWGNHTGLYRPLSYVPAWVEITGKPSFSTVATSGSFNDLSSNPFGIVSPLNDQLLRFNSTAGKWENWTPTYLASFTETDPEWTTASTNYYSKTDLQTTGQSQVIFDNITNRPSTLVGYGIIDADPSSTNELNSSFTLSENTLSLTDAGGAQSVDLSKYLDDKDEQTLSINGNQISISNGNTVDIGSIADELTFNIDRPITRQGLGSATGQNLGQGKTMSEFLEAFFFPPSAATPPVTTFTTSQTVFPYSVWKNWSNSSSDISFNWSITNQSKLDATDDKDITSIKLFDGSTELATVTPDNSSSTQNGVFNSVQFKNTSGSNTTDFSKIYSFEVVDAQPNTVTKNLALTMSKALRLTYGSPTLTPSTTVYEYSNSNISLNLNWNISTGDETISDIKIEGTSIGSTAASGSQTVYFKTLGDGGTQSQSFGLQVTGDIYGIGTLVNSNSVKWENRLYRGVITSLVSPCDDSFSFTDDQVKALAQNQLGGTWKNSSGFDFTCNAGGQYIVFAYPDDAVLPVVQYYDSNFNSWLTYSNIKVIDRLNFVNQNGYNGTNYKLVFVCVEYKNVTVKLRIQL